MYLQATIVMSAIYLKQHKNLVVMSATTITVLKQQKNKNFLCIVTYFILLKNKKD